jgi:penicillin amidase
LGQALERLANWDLQEHKDGTEAAIYEVIWARLLSTLFEELPEDPRFKGGGAPMVLVRDLLTQPQSPWWDDKSTATVETRADILLRALQEGYAWLDQHHGGVIDKWTWGQLHTATFENQSLGQSGIGLIEAIFNRGPVTARTLTQKKSEPARELARHYPWH